MWEKTLIESKGYGRGTKTKWAIPAAFCLHVGIILVTIVASYWHVEALDAPQSSLTYVRPIDVTFTPPPAFGQKRKPATTQKQSVTSPQSVQPTVVPALTSQASDVEDSGANDGAETGADLPAGVPWGVDGGDPNSTSLSQLGPFNAEGEEPRIITVDTTLPVLLKKVQPEYPKSALATRTQGIVILQAIITRTGSVEQVTTLRSDNPLLETAAKEAVLQWKYKPATLRGQPIKVYFTVTVTFHMR